MHTVLIAHRDSAYAEHLAHPETPLLLDWSPDGQLEPDVVREIKQRAPNMHAAVRDRAALVEEVGKLLAAHTPPKRSAAP